MAGQLEAVADPSPVETVDLASLLRDICIYLNRFLAMKEDEFICIALWVAHTHVIDAAEQTPYLNVRSPEPECGKSRVLEIIKLMCPNAEYMVKPSAASVFRGIEFLGQPTLLLDEIDAIWNERGDENEDLRAILNSGHRRGASVLRCAGPNHDIHRFPTFCAKALGGIGKPPATIAGRSIPIELKRKTRDDKVERWRLGDDKKREEAEALGERLAIWATNEVKMALQSADPILPDELSDRQHDSAEILLAIADLAENGWEERTRNALVNVYKGEAAAVDSSLRLRLLADTKKVWVWDDRVASSVLVEALKGIEDAPWGERNLSMSNLAFHLKNYDIKPRSHRFGMDTHKGYLKAEFQDAWDRYLPTDDQDAVTV